jgi:hypothetical protein
MGPGEFRYPIPEDKHGITALYVSALGMPVQRSPEPTDDPGIFRLGYPIRPGITRVGVSFTVPYNAGEYTLRLPLLYDIDELIVYGVDPDMTITSESVSFTVEEAAHDMVALTATHLQRGTDLAIRFVGGSGESSVPASSGGVIVVPNDMEGASLMIMFIVLLTLLAFMGIATTGASNPLDQPESVRAYYDTLVGRLARLDDLREAQAIPTDVYRARRDELKGQLGALMQRLRDIETGAGAQKGGPASTTPGTAGGERRNAS